MSNEIATYSMILSKLSLGKSGAECPTKTQILAINSLIIIDNASTYGANECVKIDDIRKKAEEVVNKLTLNSLTYDNCYLFLPGTKPVESNVWSYLMFMANTSFNWYASLGITVNGGTAHAGNLVNIYVYSSGSYKLVKSFQLQLGEQTVTY